MNSDEITLNFLKKERLDALHIQSQEEFLAEVIDRTFGQREQVGRKPDILRYNIEDGRFEIKFFNPVLK